MATPTRLIGGIGSLVGLAIGISLYMATHSRIMLEGAAVLAVLPLLVVFIFEKFTHKFPVAGVDLDLTYLVKHMLSVSTGKPPRSVLFKVVSDEKLYPGYTGIFKKIYVLGKEWGYSFNEACKLMARNVRNKIVKEFLVRLGSVLAVGGDVELFLRTEYMTIISEYETTYNRVVDGARVFLGVYTSMLAASIFMLANFLLMAFFFGGSPNIVVLSFVSVLLTVGSVSILVFLVMPKEVYEIRLEKKPEIYRLIDMLTLAGTVSTLISIILIWKLRGLNDYTLAAMFIAAGLSLLPAGMLSKNIEKRIKDIDDFFPIFIRSYGMHLQTVPQMARALRPLLAAELGRLNRMLERLYARLINNIEPSVAWKLFSIETGSELVHRSVKIFLDTVEHGGRISEVGAMLSDHHNTIIRLRKNRLQVGKTFETTTYMLHLSVVLITVFVSGLLKSFASLLTNVQLVLPSEVTGTLFNMSMPVLLLNKMIMFFVWGITFFNALSITRALPGVSRSFWYYLSLLSIISGAAVIAGTSMLNLILGSSLQALNRTLLLP